MFQALDSYDSWKKVLTALTSYTWIHVFVTVVTWICQSCYIHFSPFAKQVQAEVWLKFWSSLIGLKHPISLGSVVPLAMFGRFDGPMSLSLRKGQSKVYWNVGWGRVGKTFKFWFLYFCNCLFSNQGFSLVWSKCNGGCPDRGCCHTSWVSTRYTFPFARQFICDAQRRH